jgi:hypothetical protein
LFRTGSLLQLEWLDAVARRTRQFLAKMPKASSRESSRTTKKVASRGRVGG